MRTGDKFRVVKGAHEGKTGVIMAEYMIGAIGIIGGHAWFVELEDGLQDILQEDMMEVIQPE